MRTARPANRFGVCEACGGKTPATCRVQWVRGSLALCDGHARAASGYMGGSLAETMTRDEMLRKIR